MQNQFVQFLAILSVLCSIPCPDLWALDTLRVGNAGKVSWSGVILDDAIAAAPPEYKVNRFATEIGNVPGNLIDLSNLDATNTQVLVKTLIDAPPELIEGEVALVEAQLLDVVSSLAGAAAVESSV
ncbi:MAG: hypothetical protein QGH25_08170, partial [Candidatus Latescibacteria bacterium]|nr:hypothetical protein [Candidatus Latescibacterota bacterium]